MTARNYAICLSKEQIKTLFSLINFTEKKYFDKALENVQSEGYSYILKDQTTDNYVYKITSDVGCLELKKWKRPFNTDTPIYIYPNGNFLGFKLKG